MQPCYRYIFECTVTSTAVDELTTKQTYRPANMHVYTQITIPNRCFRDVLLYLVHRVGASRCLPGTANCLPGCVHGGSHDGMPPGGKPVLSPTSAKQGQCCTPFYGAILVSCSFCVISLCIHFTMGLM